MPVREKMNVVAADTPLSNVVEEVEDAGDFYCLGESNPPPVWAKLLSSLTASVEGWDLSMEMVPDFVLSDDDGKDEAEWLKGVQLRREELRKSRKRQPKSLAVVKPPSKRKKRVLTAAK